MRRLFLILIAFSLFSFSLFAESECDTDADCEAGAHCVKTPCPACFYCECPECDPEGTCINYKEGPDDFFASGLPCEVDDECPTQFLCEEAVMPCMNYPSCPPCVCETCEEGEECPECKCEPCPEEEPCDDELVKQCVFHPVECVVDADCGENFVCENFEECSGGSSTCICTACECAACPDGEECPPCDCPEEPVCECDEEPIEEECTSNGAYCVPAELPCENDDQCDEGWTCLMKQSLCLCGCACGGVPCDGEDCPEPDCECPDCECDDMSEGVCIPAGWEDLAEHAEEVFGPYGQQGSSTTNPDDKKEEDNNTTDPKVETPATTNTDGGASKGLGVEDGSGGCSATGGAGSPGLIALFLLMGMALFTLRRKVGDNA